MEMKNLVIIWAVININFNQKDHVTEFTNFLQVYLIDLVCNFFV